MSVREFYEDKSTGEHRPGQAGLNMSVDQWRKVVEGVPTIQAALGAPGDCHVEIGGLRRLSASEWKGRKNVGLREWYEAPDGQVHPGKKGAWALAGAGAAAAAAAAGSVDSSSSRVGRQQQQQGRSTAAAAGSVDSSSI